MFLAFILVLSVFTAAFAVVAVATWGSFDESDTFLHVPSSPETRVSWRVEVDTARIDVRFTSDPAAPDATFTVRHQGSGPFLAGKTAADLYTTTFSNASGHKSLVMRRVDPFIPVVQENSSILVTLKTNIIYGLVLHTITGSTSLVVPASQALANVSVQTTTGSARVELGNDVHVAGPVSVAVTTGSIVMNAGANVSIDGNLALRAITGRVNVTMGSGAGLGGTVALQSTTGSIAASMNGPSFSGDVTLNTTTGSITVSVVNMTATAATRLDAGVTTGSITATFVQRQPAGANVSSTMATITGNINVSFETGDGDASVSFIANPGTGSNTFTDHGGFEIMPGNALFRTVDQGLPPRMDFQLHTTTGSIAVTGRVA